MSFKNSKHFYFGFDFADVFAVQNQDQNLLPAIADSGSCRLRVLYCVNCTVTRGLLKVPEKRKRPAPICHPCQQLRR